jgi:hypothetical protein
MKFRFKGIKVVTLIVVIGTILALGLAMHGCSSNSPQPQTQTTGTVKVVGGSNQNK